LLRFFLLFFFLFVCRNYGQTKQVAEKTTTLAAAEQWKVIKI